jgi:urease accessory protein
MDGMPDCATDLDPARLHDTAPAPWHASLRLRFARDGQVTRLVERRHSGPLRVQKALYPEGGAICHAIVVHPPGGVVGGDTLAVEAAVGDGAHVLLTTPGAGKWYRANGRQSRQTVTLAAASDACLEWLPQETILYDGACVSLEHTVELAAGARYIGIEILCFGRRASGEAFNTGVLRQRSQIRRDGTLLWWEQGAMAAGSTAMKGVTGLRGASVCATLIAVGPALPAPLIAQIRALDPALGASQLKQLFVARLLGDDSETARRVMLAAWQLLRPHLLGCPAPAPRSWHT